MRKIDILAYMVGGLIYLVILNMWLQDDLADYLKYKENKDKYRIETVKVEEKRSQYRSHVDIGIFYYFDNLGVYKQGEVLLHYDENEGDYIKVAFDEYGNYIRPIITVSGGGIIHYFVMAIVGIAIIWEAVKEYKEGKKDNV